MTKNLAMALALSTLLAACGGGGGNPGQCQGSAPVCLDGDNPNVGATGSTTGSVSPTVTTTTPSAPTATTITR